MGKWRIGSWLAVAAAVTVWGVTFASTRALLVDFSALEILIVRFGLAFAALSAAELAGHFGKARCPADDKSVSLNDFKGLQWLFAAMGLTGIVAYQFLENCAIYYTNASNVAILVSFGPIVTALLARAFGASSALSARVVAGSLVAVAGVALVSLNGLIAFEIRPLGDLMAAAAMLSWGFYSILLDKANSRGVSPLVAIRKSFGWSLAIMAPFALWGMTDSGVCALDGSFAVFLDKTMNAERFGSVQNIMNFAFLGLFASAASFVLWSAACRALGVVKTTVSLYLTPIVGVLFAVLFLDESVTMLEVLGGFAILAGVVIATKKRGEEK